MARSVYLAHTGGTIGMRRTAKGYAPEPGYLAEHLAAMPELQAPDMPRLTVREYTPLLDSADMTPHDWERIGRDIVAHHDQHDGFVVLHGTDTMAYSASALSFMLENLAKPVILTGSQIPLAEVRSDARENLITSLLLAAHYPLPEVCIYLSGQLLRGNRARKVSASGFDAFASPNAPPLGTVGVEIAIAWERVRPQPSAEVALQPLGDVSVGALRLFPGITAGIVENLLRAPVRGMVLETYGAGNAPARDSALMGVLEAACARGVVIVNCTQCLRGSVMMSYATGHALQQAGVVSGHDMTPEAALTKLFYLLSKGLPLKAIRQLVQQDLRGELTSAT